MEIIFCKDKPYLYLDKKKDLKQNFVYSRRLF